MGSAMGEHDSKVEGKATRMGAANKTGDGAGASGPSIRKPWTDAEKLIVWERMVRAVNTFLSCTPMYASQLISVSCMKGYLLKCHRHICRS